MPPHAGEPGPIGSIGGYALVDRLGSGGMGVVYLGHSASGRQVAVKVVHAQYALDEEFRARFRQEIVSARRVSGAFTAPVVDADPDAELPWMATLYVPGLTLSQKVDKEGPLGGRELRALALGLVEALRDIHQAGVVHRDLKPSNVLMAGDGPRVIDFGISRAADNQALTVTGRLIGTPPFMSPEQFVSPRDVTAASDVFSLGSLLVFAATGNGPFDAGSPYVTGYQVMNEPPSLDGVPQPLRGIAERCLDKDPAARPQLAELQALFGSMPDTAAPAGPGVAHLPSVPGNGDGPHGPAATTTAATTTADTTTADTTATGAAAGRGRRVRRLLVLGAVLAVAAAAVPVYHLVSGPDTTEGGSGDRASGAGTSASPALPAGWQPWRTDLTRAVKNESLVTNVDSVDSGCVSGGASLYCAGTGFTVARIDAASGRVKWRFGSNSQAAARPLGVRDGLVYTHVQPNEDSVYSTQELVGVDTDSGKRVWTRTIDAGYPAVLFDGGILAMSGEGAEFVALDPKTGKNLWRTPAKSSAGTACAPTVLGGAPYGICVNEDDPFKGDAGFLSLAPADGTARELAELPLLAEPLGMVGGQPLFALRQSEESQSDNGRDEPYSALLQVNPKNGDVIRIPLKGTPRGLPGLVGTAVYFVRPDGTVTATGADDGARLWQKGTQVENLSAPVLSTKYDHLYFVNRYGRLLALDRETGAVQWTTDKLNDPGTSAENRIPSTLLVKDALVAVAGDTAFSVSPDQPSQPVAHLAPSRGAGR